MRTFHVVLRCFTLAAALGLSTRAAAAHSGGLEVQPVISAEAARERLRLGLPVVGRPMTEAEARVQSLRLQRHRESLPLKQAAMGEGRSLRLDRSVRGNRRVGWQAPAGRLAGPEPEAPDTIRLALLRIDFLNDRAGSRTTGNGRFDLTPADTNAVPLDRAPRNRSFYEQHGEALSRYISAQSYGRLVLEVDVWPPEQDSAYHCNDKADFGPWRFSREVYRSAVSMMRTMFFAADSQSIARGQRVPWDEYDRFTILHAGSDLQSDLNGDSELDIPSFTIFVADTDVVIFPDSTTRPIDRVAYVPETINQDGYFGTINGVLAHENGHNLFGLADIYDINSGFPVCGYWTLMDSGNLVGSRVMLGDGSEIFATGLLPPSFDPFQRQFIGDGLRFTEVASGDTVTLRASQRYPDIARVWQSTDEYLLIENRAQAPAAAVQLDQDTTTRVILGPKQPDRFEYDALLPGGGMLIWQQDDSVIPFETALRTNPDFGFNSNPFRLGLQLIEADGLDDLGDPGSPFLSGSPLDPWQRRINPVLSDSTQPDLIPNQGTRPHLRIDILDDAGETMRFALRRDWSRAGWPVVVGNFPPGGPRLLAIDADGDRLPEVCWAGGDTLGPDSSAVFAVRQDGTGLQGDLAFARLDRRPLPVMAAALTGDEVLGEGPAVFVLTTSKQADDDPLGGQVWMLDPSGAPRAGWPLRPPGGATTPPLLLGAWPDLRVVVGCGDGRVRTYSASGQLLATAASALGGPINGRLALWREAGSGPLMTEGLEPQGFIAAGTAGGEVTALRAEDLATMPGWPRTIARPGTEREFAFVRFSGDGSEPIADCAAGTPTLIVRDLDRVLAYCLDGEALAGWGTSLGDTLVDGIAIGDPDGDGLPEVLVQTRRSALAFLNRSGHPTPGWPKRGTDEDLATDTPPLAVDVDGDGRAEVVALNGSGVVAALDGAGRSPRGWPLATGAGAAGSMVATDLDRNGRLDLVAPDRLGLLYAYQLPVLLGDPRVTSWTMLGGDPARTASLPSARATAPRAEAGGPLVRGSLKAYPNPARREPVRIGMTLTEPAALEFRVLDTSGQQVADFRRDGQVRENVVVWDPGALPAGLYMVRVRITGASGARDETLAVGLLR